MYGFSAKWTIAPLNILSIINKMFLYFKYLLKSKDKSCLFCCFLVFLPTQSPWSLKQNLFMFLSFLAMVNLKTQCKKCLVQPTNENFGPFQYAAKENATIDVVMNPQNWSFSMLLQHIFCVFYNRCKSKTIKWQDHKKLVFCYQNCSDLL